MSLLAFKSASLEAAGIGPYPRKQINGATVFATFVEYLNDLRWTEPYSRIRDAVCLGEVQPETAEERAERTRK